MQTGLNDMKNSLTSRLAHRSSKIFHLVVINLHVKGTFVGKNPNWNVLRAGQPDIEATVMIMQLGPNINIAHWRIFGEP